MKIIDKFLKSCYLVILLAVFILNGCALKFYVPAPVPLAIPEKKNSISGSMGLPTYVEYQKSVSDKVDVVASAGNMSGKVKRNDVEYSATYTNILLGGNYWFMQRDKEGFGLGAFSGINIIMNDESFVKWNQTGVEAGLLPGFYSNGFIFAVPLRISAGTASGGGSYHHGGLGAQFIFKGKNFGAGMRLDYILGAGSFSDTNIGYSAVLVPTPVTMGLFLLGIF